MRGSDSFGREGRTAAVGRYPGGPRAGSSNMRELAARDKATESLRVAMPAGDASLCTACGLYASAVYEAGHDEDTAQQTASDCQGANGHKDLADRVGNAAAVASG